MTTSSEALASLNSFNSTRKSAATAATEAEAKYDVNGTVDRVSNLKGLTNSLQAAVEAVDPSVTGRTSGSFVTEAQRSALVNREQAPILQDLGKQQTAYGEEKENLNMAQTLAGQFASSLIADENTKYSTLKDSYDSAVTQEAEAARLRQQEEENRRWWEQFNESKRQFEAQLAESRAASQRQLQAIRTQYATPTYTAPAAAPKATAAPVINKTYTDKSGQTTGYETQYGSQLTAYGQQQQKKQDEWDNKNWASKVLSTIGLGWLSR